VDKRKDFNENFLEKEKINFMIFKIKTLKVLILQVFQKKHKNQMQ
jgi:hypothetical protein